MQTLNAKEIRIRGRETLKGKQKGSGDRQGRPGKVNKETQGDEDEVGVR